MVNDLGDEEMRDTHREIWRGVGLMEILHRFSFILFTCAKEWVHWAQLNKEAALANLSRGSL